MGILKNYLCHLFIKFSSAFLWGISSITERFMSTNILHHVFIRDEAILNSVSSVCESSLDLLLTLKCQIFSCVIRNSLNAIREKYRVILSYFFSLYYELYILSPSPCSYSSNERCHPFLNGSIMIAGDRLKQNLHSSIIFFSPVIQISLEQVIHPL